MRTPREKGGRMNWEIGIDRHALLSLTHIWCWSSNTLVRTGQGSTDWFQIGTGVHQGCILSLCVFDLYAEYIMWNSGLDEGQPGIKTAGRNINDLRYADNTTLKAESEEELKSLLIKMKKECEKAVLKLNIQKTNIMASDPIQFSSVQSCPTLRPHELQHARPPCPSPTPGVHSDSCPSSQWWHPAISSSVVPFSPAPNPSQHHSLFQRVNSSHEVAKVLEFQLQHHSFQWTPRADLLQNELVAVLLAVQGTLKSLLQHHSSKASILRCSAFFTVQLSHLYMTTGKNIALTRWTLVGKVMSLILNMLSRLVITFLPRSKRL